MTARQRLFATFVGLLAASCVLTNAVAQMSDNSPDDGIWTPMESHQDSIRFMSGRQKSVQRLTEKSQRLS